LLVSADPSAVSREERAWLGACQTSRERCLLPPPAKGGLVPGGNKHLPLWAANHSLRRSSCAERPGHHVDLRAVALERRDTLTLADLVSRAITGVETPSPRSATCVLRTAESQTWRKMPEPENQRELTPVFARTARTLSCPGWLRREVMICWKVVYPYGCLPERAADQPHVCAHVHAVEAQTLCSQCLAGR
jgi:hypothetical protein